MKNTSLIAIALVFFAIACKGSVTLAENTAVNSDDGVTEKYWKLVEINGNPVSSGDLNRDAYIVLKNEDNRLNGNGGCNTLTASYEIDHATNRIRFSQIATSMMACLNMEIEDALKRVLETADNFSLSADGNFLSLNRARMAPLARFELVYLR